MSTLMNVEGDLEATGELKGNISDPDKSEFTTSIIKLVYEGIDWKASNMPATVLSASSFKGNLHLGCQGNGKIYVFDGSNYSESTDTVCEDIRALIPFGHILFAAGKGYEVGKIYTTNPPTDEWVVSTDTSPFPAWSLCVYEGKIYAGLGNDSSFSSKIIYNDGGWYDSTTLDTNKIYSMAVYNGKLYACTSVGNSTGGKVYVYDGSSWSLSTDVGQSIDLTSLVVYNNKLYCAGTNNTIYIYDDNVWNTFAIEKGSRMGVYNGKLYIGGDNNGKLFIFNGSEWAESTDTTATSCTGFAVYNGKLYVALDIGVYEKQDSFMQIMSKNHWNQNQ
ncbi:MAG: hypothetical protein A2297_10215 [Elusimicrobia bacterium RIFOXYB2_FULL_48_7]|nr:MAG: hypothetical protein A2297_10215 [Elusimicrobia bacterium RIFOXYB2_FULL_48_7]